MMHKYVAFVLCCTKHEVVRSNYLLRNFIYRNIVMLRIRLLSYSFSILNRSQIRPHIYLCNPRTIFYPRFIARDRQIKPLFTDIYFYSFVVFRVSVKPLQHVMLCLSPSRPSTRNRVRGDIRANLFVGIINKLKHHSTTITTLQCMVRSSTNNDIAYYLSYPKSRTSHTRRAR